MDVAKREREREKEGELVECIYGGLLAREVTEGHLTTTS